MVPNSDKALKFLLTIFDSDINMIATLVTAQAEDKPDILIETLEAVKDFCDQLIGEIKDGNNRDIKR